MDHRRGTKFIQRCRGKHSVALQLSVQVLCVSNTENTTPTSPLALYNLARLWGVYGLVLSLAVYDVLGDSGEGEVSKPVKSTGSLRRSPGRRLGAQRFQGLADRTSR